MAERTRILKTRVTEKEYQAIMENCIKSGRTVSELLRESACEKGNNLNQLTVMARQERVQLINFELFVEVYSAVWQVLNSLLSCAA